MGTRKLNPQVGKVMPNFVELQMAIRGCRFPLPRNISTLFTRELCGIVVDEITDVTARDARHQSIPLVRVEAQYRRCAFNSWMCERA